MRCSPASTITSIGQGFEDLILGQALPLLIGKMALLSFAVYFAGVALGLLYIVTVPRLLNVFLQPGKTYVLYGFHYYIHQLIVRTSNSQFYNRSSATARTSSITCDGSDGS